MKLKEILSPSFESILKAVPKQVTDVLWRRCLSIGSQFCEAVVQNGYLTWEQMLHAAVRYRLGCTRQRGVIFWQMDQEGRIHDGKVMYYGPDCHRLKDKPHHPTWVSTLICRRYHWQDCQQASHCFFGLHLLGHTDTTDITDDKGLATIGTQEICVPNKSVCVVEAEKTAFILSEHYPQYIWLAAGGLGELQVEKFRPLRGHKVILFPDTDPDGIAFRRWYDVAQAVMTSPFWEGSPPIRVSPILELNANMEQKLAKIDLVEFLFYSERN